MAAFPDTTTLPENRPDLEALIEAAIARLDELNPDAGDDEPALGWTDLEARSGRYGPSAGVGLEADDADDEPSMGSTHEFSQARWGAWSGDDREQECEDEGAQCDDEGWREEDRGADEDEGTVSDWNSQMNRRQMGNWRAEVEKQMDAQLATTRACQTATDDLRAVQRRNGGMPMPPLRVLGGAVVRG